MDAANASAAFPRENTRVFILKREAQGADPW